MPVTKKGQIELYYEVDDHGADTVALINGIAMTVQSWQSIRERLSAGGFRCLVHDCRGQLRSEKPIEGSYSMAVHAADLMSLLDELELERVHLIGTSYGSEVAMIFARDYPARVRSLCVIAGVSEADDLLRAAIESWAIAADAGAIPFFRTMLPWAYSNDFLAAHGPRLREQELAMRKLPPEYFNAFKRLAAAYLQLDITADLTRIVCPTLVISAELDLLKGPKFGRVIHENIVGSEFVVIPGAGHAVVLEQPNRVAELCMNFLNRHGFALH